MSSPDSSRQDTFRLGSRTKAIMATHKPMANAVEERRRRLEAEQELTKPAGLCGADGPSMRSQCPVRTQISTSMTEREKERSSARVKRPQQPKEILQAEAGERSQGSAHKPTG